MSKTKLVTTEVIRCSWLTKDPIYIKYHDEEWGKPEYNNLKLFEMICLEGQQAGLSWITILKKREYYRKVFFNFDPEIISNFQPNDIDRLKTDSGIVRHKAKIEAIVNNAKAYLKMKQNGEVFTNFIWSFVDHKPIINLWQTNIEIPNETILSKSLSKALKERGFKFVGSKICYAFMQACGLVDDHIINCCCKNS